MESLVALLLLALPVPTAAQELPTETTDQLDRLLEDLRAEEIEVRQDVLSAIEALLRSDPVAHWLERRAEGLDSDRRSAVIELVSRYRKWKSGWISFLRRPIHGSDFQLRRMMSDGTQDEAHFGWGNKGELVPSEYANLAVCEESLVYFSSWRGNAPLGTYSDQSIISLNLKTSKLTVLSQEPCAVSSPMFLPDGGILYIAEKDDGFAFHRLDPKTGDIRRLGKLKDVQPEYRDRAAFDPRGEFVLLPAKKNGKFGVCRVSMNGTDLELLNDWVEGPIQIAISPDGSRISFAGHPKGSDKPDLWLMDRKGTNVRRLTETSEEGERYPSFSPDGRRIVCSRYKGDGSESESEEDLVVFDLETEKEKVIGEGHAPFWGPSLLLPKR